MKKHNMPFWVTALALAVCSLLTTGCHNASPRSSQVVALGQVKRPQIPTENFEWNGTFIVPGQERPAKTRLTIRGMWQNGDFNLYMEQGFKEDAYWVENLIYEKHLYTITHKWPGVSPPVSKICYMSEKEITVEVLNAILARSQHVGLIKIDGRQ